MEASRAKRVAIIGVGRAGGAFGLALERAGWTVRRYHSTDDVHHAAKDVDLVLVCCPDLYVADVAATIAPEKSTVIAHVAGSLGLDVMSGHARTAAIHPLMALPSAALGAERLRGAWFAVAGDAIVHAVVADLDGRSFEIADADRALYHAAAVVASNHVVGVLGQAERLANAVGAPFEAFASLVRATVENVVALGPADALTGPAARGDEATLDRHRAALPEDESDGYEAGVALARRLVKRRQDEGLTDADGPT